MNEHDYEAWEQFLEQADILEILGDTVDQLLWDAFTGDSIKDRIEKALRDEFQRLKMVALEDQAEADYEAYKAWRDQ